MQRKGQSTALPNEHGGFAKEVSNPRMGPVTLSLSHTLGTIMPGTQKHLEKEALTVNPVLFCFVHIILFV